MPTTTFLARSTPYRPAPPVSYPICTRCGIGFKNHNPKRGVHTECRDCREIS